MRARWHWLIPGVVIAGLLFPLFQDRTFSSDWGDHLWLIWQQELDIKQIGHPSYFLQSSLGVFYPYYAFYGGSLYAVLGVVSALANPATAVFVAFLGSLCAAYFGWTWIAWQLGVRGWQAQLPGALAVTAPIAVTNMYGRGDIPEAVATGMLPLVAASALSLVREPTVRLRSAALFVLGVAVLTGSHTLTLAWGVVFLLLCAALLVACYWSEIRERAGRGLRLVGLGALGVGINAWILVPLLLYHPRLIEHEPDPIGDTLYTDPSRLFSPLRNAGIPYSYVTADVNAQLPVLALAWALICAVLYRRFLSGRSRALLAGFLGFLAGLVVLILSPALIESLPEALRYIQFPYRILTYADLCVVALVTMVLAAAQKAGSRARIAVWALAAVAAFNFVLSVNQNIQVRSFLSGRAEALASSTHPPPSWYAPLQFADGSAPIVKPTLAQPLHFPANGPKSDAYTATYPAGPAGTAATNVDTGTYFVEVVGAEPVGRTEGGRMVVRLPASSGQRTVEARASWGSAVTLGQWLSVASLAAALAAAAIVLVRRRTAPPSDSFSAVRRGRAGPGG